MSLRWIYACLVVVRFLLCVQPQPGYIHPDEFFQSIEISAGDVLQWQTNKPWEFDPRFAIRSRAIIDAFLNAPLAIYLQMRRYWPSILSQLIEFDLLTFCRVWTALCSLVVDASVWLVSERCGADRALSLVLLGSSHVALVVLTRPFSNCWETQLSALLLVALYRRPNADDIGRPAMLLEGAVVAVGTFCRPTFALFVAAHIAWRMAAQSMRQRCQYVLTGLASFTGVAALLVSVDTARYGTLAVAPLNFVAHNRRSANLAAHGIHPRWTHIAANVPLLLGPLAPLVCLCPWLLLARHKRWPPLFASMALPVAALSALPHQEMRFLLPAFVPAIVLASMGLQQLWHSHRRIAQAILVAHLLFSGASVAFWGYLHEGRLLVASRLIRDEMAQRQGCHVAVTYRCLTMPLFLLQLSHHHRQHGLHNLMGIDESQFWHRLADISLSVTANATTNGAANERCLMHLVFPKAYPFQQPDRFSQLGKLITNRTMWGHVNTDLWPPRVSLYDFFSLQYLTFSL